MKDLKLLEDIMYAGCIGNKKDFEYLENKYSRKIDSDENLYDLYVELNGDKRFSEFVFGENF